MAKNQWETLKELDVVKVGEKSEVKLTVDSNGERAILNIRTFYNGNASNKGIAIDLDNEELLLAIYNSIGTMLDKPVRVKAEEPKPEPEKKMTKNARKRLARLGVAL